MDRLRLQYLENAHLVLDVGLTYTKIGFAKESMPLHIFQTPLSMVQALHNQHEQYIYTYQVPQHYSKSTRENLSKLNASTFPDLFRLEDKRLQNEVEEFMTTTFYHVLKTSPKDKCVVLVERLGGMRKLTEAIAWVLFKKLQVKAIYSLLANALPIYACGVDSGLVVDCGFQQVEILPFAMSQVCIEGFQICYAGGAHIEQNLSKLIRDDNQRLLAKLIQQLPHYKDDLPSKIIEDVKVRCLFTMQVEQKKEYLGLNDPKSKADITASKELQDKYKGNLEKMQKKMTAFGK